MSWTAIWVAWFLSVAVTFGVAEWLAIRTRDPDRPRKVDTLTSVIQRKLIGVDGAKWRIHVAAGVFAAVVAGLAAWGFAHLFGGYL